MFNNHINVYLTHGSDGKTHLLTSNKLKNDLTISKNIDNKLTDYHKIKHSKPIHLNFNNTMNMI